MHTSVLCGATDSRALEGLVAGLHSFWGVRVGAGAVNGHSVVALTGAPGFPHYGVGLYLLGSGNKHDVGTESLSDLPSRLGALLLANLVKRPAESASWQELQAGCARAEVMLKHWPATMHGSTRAGGVQPSDSAISWRVTSIE
jgi:hypothetical protein